MCISIVQEDALSIILHNIQYKLTLFLIIQVAFVVGVDTEKMNTKRT